jgi:hypothetical protein
MKNRFLSLFALCSLVLSGLLFSSCDETATIPEATFFGQVRVMNFAVCTGPKSYDVYLYPSNGPADTIPKAIALAYGVSTPYITNLGTNKGAGQEYTVVIRPAGDKIQNLKVLNITVRPNDKWSVMLFSQLAGTSEPEVVVVNDNSMPGDDPGPITIKVDDPLSGKVLASDISYKNISDYMGFKTATDTTVTLYAIKSSDGTVLGRLAGVAFEGGSYKTITWGGNCPDNYRQQEEGVSIKDDSNRIRIFGDSDLGNDVTLPVPQTMRFNFVNALVNTNLPSSDPKFAALNYQHLGVVINNDTRFNFANMTPFSVGPTPLSHRTKDLGNGSMYYENYPISLPLTDAVNVKGFKMDPAQPNVRGTLLYDYRAGERINIKSDMLTTLVVHDSIRFTRKVSADKKDTTYSVSPLDSARYQFVIAVPDVPDPNNATLIIANALAPGYKSSATVTNVDFYLNDNPVAFTGTWSVKKTKTESLSPGTYTIKGELNTTPPEAFSATFDVEAGGIYEAFFVGERNHTDAAFRPRFIILRVNPKD